MILSEIAEQLSRRKRRLQDDLAVRASLEQARGEVLRAAEAARDRIEHQVDVSAVLAEVERVQQDRLARQVNDLASLALTTIFEKPLRLEVEFDRRGAQADAKFKIRDAEDRLVSLRDAHGGGLVAVSAFMMTVVLLKAIRPPLRQLVILDEPFVHVARAHRPKLVEFVRQLAESCGIQFLIVTHVDELTEVGDKRYRFVLRGGVARAEAF